MIIAADTDRFVREVIEQDEYSFLFKNLVIVDVGCNIGTFSLWLYELASKIYAIDIAKENINNLNETIKLSKLDPEKIKTYCCGIAGQSAKRGIDDNGQPAADGGWKLNGSNGEIEVFSMKAFMDKEEIDHIDVLKIDVEGCEEDILSALDFPADRISTIVGEIHGGKNAEVMACLNRFDYITYDLGGHFLARKK